MIFLKREYDLNFRAVNKKSTDIFKQHQHAILGISPFNSYYTEQKVNQLIEWAFYYFDDFHVFLGDELSIYNFISRGYDETKSRQKTNDEDNRLRNRILRAFHRFDIPETKILKYALLQHQANYQDLQKYYQELANQNTECVKHLRHTIHKLNFSEKIRNYNAACKYLLYELPILMNSPHLLELSSSIFIYHRIPEFIDYLYNCMELQEPNQGFMAVEFEQHLNVAAHRL